MRSAHLCGLLVHLKRDSLMTYTEISVLCEKLSKNDKLRLMQSLIVQVMREDEEKQPKVQIPPKQTSVKEKVIVKEKFENLHYDVLERLLKSKPGKKTTLQNFIAAMFQFRGGISENEIETIIKDLQRMKYIQIDSNNKVSYHD